MLPEKQGLYSPEFEHDNCGAGFICSLQGKKTHDIIHKALDILDCLLFVHAAYDALLEPSGWLEHDFFLI